MSSLTGKGFDELISLLPTLTKEYEDYYEADLKLTQAKNQRDPAQVQKEQVQSKINSLEKPPLTCLRLSRLPSRTLSPQLEAQPPEQRKLVRDVVHNLN